MALIKQRVYLGGGDFTKDDYAEGYKNVPLGYKRRGLLGNKLKKRYYGNVVL